MLPDQNGLTGVVQLVGGLEIYFNNAKKETGSETEGIYGCEEKDFEGANFTDKIALLYRGKCKFEDKILNASNAKAKGVVVVNNNPEGVITMNIGGKSKYFYVIMAIKENYL